MEKLDNQEIEVPIFENKEIILGKEQLPPKQKNIDNPLITDHVCITEQLALNYDEDNVSKSKFEELEKKSKIEVNRK